MPSSRPTSPPERPRRRADAERSVARILDSAVDALAVNPDVSMAEIARQSGVVRATVYVHFPTREALLDAVTARAIDTVADVIDAAEPTRGEAAEALERIVRGSWQTLGRFHALVALNTSTQDPAVLHERHAPVIARLAPVIARGQADGTFRPDAPVSWHLSTVMALVHNASNEVHAGRITEADAEAALVASVLGALAA